MSDRSRLQAARHWKSYTDLATADIDLRKDGPAGDVTKDALKMSPREVLVVSGGVLVFVRPDGNNDTTPDLPSGTRLKIQPSKILKASSGTTATAVMVFW